jgi:ELWxxDGT repeat protein
MIEPLESRRLLSLSLVADLRPGTAGSGTHPYFAHRGLVYFTARPTGSTAAHLFVTDGSPAGTIDLNVQPTRSELVAAGDLVYFAGAGGKLFRTDGTPAGTVAVPGPSDPSQLTATADGQLYFTATTPANGRELWKVDYSGAVFVRDVTPGPADTSFRWLAAVGDTLYFHLPTYQLWKTDGTPAGTLLVKDFNAIGTPTYDPVGAGGKLFFPVRGERLELWTSDGSAAGTTSLGPIASHNSNFDPLLTATGDAVFLRGQALETGVELWTSDGTAAGTGMVRDLYPGSSSSTPDGFYAHHDLVYFRAKDDVHGVELWRSDGTLDGTWLVHDVNPGVGGSTPGNFGSLGARLLFTATDAEHGRELRVTDGTSAGTTLVRDLAPGPDWGASSESVVAIDGGRALFVGSAPPFGSEPWVTDGTAAGTRLLLDLNQAGESGGVRTLGSVNGRYVFVSSAGGDSRLWATDGATTGVILDTPDPLLSYNPFVSVDSIYFTDLNGDLWRTDGTAAGTRLLARPDLGSVVLAAGKLADGSNWLSIRGPDGTRNLWRTDHTAAGTRRVRQPYGSTDVATIGGVAYFFDNRNLWRSDGTEAGTQLVTTLSSPPHALTSLNDTLLFVARDATAALQWWQSDGTAAGTKIIAPFDGESMAYLSAFGTRLYYQRGQELWTSDAAAPQVARPIAGPFSVPEPGWVVQHVVPIQTFAGGLLFEVFMQNPSLGSAGIAELWHWDSEADRTFKLTEGLWSRTVPLALSKPTVGGRVYFARETPATGTELWSSDGTVEGTGPVADLYPGPTSGGALDITATGEAVFFLGDDGPSGREIWRFTPFAHRDGDTLVLAPTEPGPHDISLAAADDGRALALTLDGAALPFSAERINAARLDGTDDDDLTVATPLDIPLHWDLSLGHLRLADNAAASLIPGAAGSLRVKSLTVGNGASLDLREGALVVDDADAAAIDASVAAGRLSPFGITSTAARSNPNTGLGTFRTHPDRESVLIKFTYNGDANGDGRINADDYFLVDSGFLDQPENPLYAEGDFNYDNNINADDYFLIDSAFLGQVATATVGSAHIATAVGAEAETSAIGRVVAAGDVIARQRVKKGAAVRPVMGLPSPRRS